MTPDREGPPDSGGPTPGGLVPADFGEAMATPGLSLMTALRQSASWEDVPSDEDHNHSDDEEDEEDRMRAAHRAQPCEAAGIDKAQMMPCLMESASFLDVYVDSDTDEEGTHPGAPERFRPTNAPQGPPRAHSF